MSERIFSLHAKVDCMHATHRRQAKSYWQVVEKCITIIMMMMMRWCWWWYFNNALFDAMNVRSNFFAGISNEVIGILRVRPIAFVCINIVYTYRRFKGIVRDECLCLCCMEIVIRVPMKGLRHFSLSKFRWNNRIWRPYSFAPRAYIIYYIFLK